MPPSNGYLSTILNPWIETPSGVADEFSMPTQCIKLRTATALPQSAGGFSALVFNPWAVGVANAWGQNATFATTTSTISGFNTLNHADLTQLETDFTRIRTVSVGVKVYYTGAEQATAGTISIVPIISTTASITSLPTDATAWLNMPGAKTVACAAMTAPLCGAFHSFDRPKFHELTDLSSQSIFPSFAVLCLGTSTGNVLRIEIETNLEVLPKLITTFNANAYSVVVPNQGAMNISRRLDSTRVGSVSHVTSLAHASLTKTSMRRKRKRSGRGMNASRYSSKRSSKKTYRKKKRSTRRRR